MSLGVLSLRSVGASTSLADVEEGNGRYAVVANGGGVILVSSPPKKARVLLGFEPYEKSSLMK